MLDERDVPVNVAKEFESLEVGHAKEEGGGRHAESSLLLRLLRKAPSKSNNDSSTVDLGIGTDDDLTGSEKIIHGRALEVAPFLPCTKLEVLRVSSVRFLIVSFLIAILASIVLTATLLGAEIHADTLVVSSVTGAAHTVTGVVMFFLCITFPQRIIVRWCRGQAVLPQQVLLAILVVIMSLCTVEGVVGLITYWVGFSRVREHMPNDTPVDLIFRIVEAYNHHVADAEVIFGPIHTVSILIVWVTFSECASRLPSEVVPLGVGQQPEASSHNRCRGALNVCRVVFRKLVVVLFILYYIVFVVLGFTLRFRPSVVPFVGIISMFRVCFYRDEHLSSSYCSLESHPASFGRALGTVFLFAFEAVLFSFGVHASRRAQKQLDKIPYSQNRVNYLMYTFVCVILKYIWIVLFILCLVEVSFFPVNYWILSPTLVEDGQNSTLVDVVDPLFRVGLTFYSAAFPSIVTAVVGTVFVITYAFLPADSVGFKGWFVGCSDDFLRTASANSREEDRIWEDYFKYNPLYFDTEETFCEFALSGGKGEYKVTQLYHGARKSNENKVQLQTQCHVLVLETEVLLFNFAALAYSISPNSAAEIPCPTDDHFSVKVLYNTGTNTLVLVAFSEDRVIVAFRGTASTVNVMTDMKLTWVNFNPLMDEKIKPAHSSNAFSELHAKETSKVHKGFNEAYRSIRSELAQVVKPLLYNADSGKQKRALFCTGHSLGGALAVLFSTDFSFSAISEKNTRLHVACTTWGCPRIGNYAFSKRAESLVPSLKRFVLAGDIIPKTPPRWHRFPYKGYYHVGVEMLLDLHGNCLRNPNLAERVFAHGLNPKKQGNPLQFPLLHCADVMGS
mmetsp:Transcript_37375/g.60839  ORF Transcript_37375/g.60839 Transcript_37375/m.60839 type:complete len:845 (-) Transcript_37375:738-3272(-)